MGVRHVQLLTVDAGTAFARPGRISTLDHKVLNVKINEREFCRLFDRGTDGDDSMEYYAVVVTAFCQLGKVLAGLRSWEHLSNCGRAQD